MSRMSTKWILALAGAAMFLALTGSALAQSATLQQCANGPASSPRPCSGAAWITGNVTKKNSHYAEDDTVPFRILLGGFVVGSPGSLTIEWDTTEGGQHAYDYVESVDATETLLGGLDPCSGAVGCNLNQFWTFPIPQDPILALAFPPVPQTPGVFLMFGGTITSVSAYQRIGTFEGRSSMTITINFTANTPNPVFAWGGHLAATRDWGITTGSSFISGTIQARLYALNGKNKSKTLSLSGIAGPGL